MKRIILSAFISLSTVFGTSAVAANSDTEPAECHPMCVNVDIAGIDEVISFDIKTLVAIYKLMPQSVKDMCVASYKDISPRLENCTNCSFNYQGVSISKIVADDSPVKVKFSYQGHHIIVNDYAKEVYDEIFGI